MAGKHRGNTITEYGFILGLVVLVAVGALMLMGGSLSSLLGGTVNTAVANGGPASGVMGLLSPVNPNGGAGNANGQGGNSGINGGRETGAGVNTTSVEGVKAGAEQTMSLSGSMKDLASADPANAGTLKQMSDLIYYMGGVQGGYLEDKKDTVRALQIQGRTKYGRNDAKYELQQYSSQLDSLMNSLPPGSPAYSEAKSLVGDAQQIADSYIGDKAAKRTQRGQQRLYQRETSLTKIQNTADTLLQDNQVNSGTEGTFVDASKMDTAAP